jgi:hypothetical protein
VKETAGEEIGATPRANVRRPITAIEVPESRTHHVCFLLRLGPPTLAARIVSTSIVDRLPAAYSMLKFSPLRQIDRENRSPTIFDLSL